MKPLLILGALVALVGVILEVGLLGVNSVAAETYANVEEVRVIARPLENGSVEFGIENRGEQLLPQGRFLTSALIQQRQGEWLASTPVQIFGVPRVPAVLGGTPAYLSDENLWELDGFGKTAASLQINVIARKMAPSSLRFCTVASNIFLKHDLLRQNYLLKVTRNGFGVRLFAWKWERLQRSWHGTSVRASMQQGAKILPHLTSHGNASCIR